jgi:hypothetical protein
LNPGPQGIQKTFVHVRSRRIRSGSVRGFGHDLAPEFLTGTPSGATCRPALVMTPFRYQDDLTVGRLHGFLGRESDCVVVRN